jgi:hypothetical protein
MLVPNGPEQLHTRPTLIGAPVAGADDDPPVDALAVPPVDPAVVLLVADLLLDEQAATSSPTASAHAPYESFRRVLKSSSPLQPSLAGLSSGP